MILYKQLNQCLVINFVYDLCNEYKSDKDRIIGAEILLFLAVYHHCLEYLIKRNDTN